MRSWKSTKRRRTRNETALTHLEISPSLLKLTMGQKRARRKPQITSWSNLRQLKMLRRKREDRQIMMPSKKRKMRRTKMLKIIQVRAHSSNKFTSQWHPWIKVWMVEQGWTTIPCSQRWATSKSRLTVLTGSRNCQGRSLRREKWNQRISRHLIWKFKATLAVKRSTPKWTIANSMKRKLKRKKGL